MNPAHFLKVTALSAALSGTAGLAQGIVGTFTDLPDTPDYGGDRWQVSYQVSGIPFSSDQGFTLYFPNTHFSDLSFQSGPAGWDVLTIRPDAFYSPGLPGFFDALALVNGPSLTPPFVIQFIKHGGDLPTSQDFEIYSLNGGFQVTANGVAKVVIPENSAWAWIPACLGLYFFGRQRLARPCRVLSFPPGRASLERSLPVQ